MSELLRAVRRWRTDGECVVFTHGAFDLLHVGHIRFLGSAGDAGDRLIVGVHRDEHVRDLKGVGRPVMTLAERMESVAALRCVSLVIEVPDPNAVHVLRRIRPQVYVKDSNVDVLNSPEASAVRGYGGEVVVVPYTPGISTSDIIGRMQQQR